MTKHEGKTNIHICTVNNRKKKIQQDQYVESLACLLLP